MSGTGKSLIALTTAWSIFKKHSCKGLIICPPSLVDNWKQEVLKWFPSTLALTALFINSANKNDCIVNEFIKSHPTRRPLLVLGYEKFCIYASALNTIPVLDLVICDEGHRLKNALGTKTTVALGNCVAMKRLILTGTPIQNDLDELFSIVQFVAPGYLGTLKTFRTKYSDVIDKGRAKSASVAEKLVGQDLEQHLHVLLSHIMLRRTKEVLLNDFLAPRKEFVILCGLLANQSAEYKKVALNALLIGHDGVENSTLPALLSLRLTCNSAPIPEIHSNQISSELSSTMLLSTSAQISTSISKITPEYSVTVKRDKILSRSAKYRCLDALVRAILAMPSKDKIVIVSNFTSTLDDIQSLCVSSCASGQWSNCAALRIDGSVALDRRSKIVKSFNSNSDATTTSDAGCSLYRILLLSSKAGGVGLNLIGANRLIMMDPDWNPASDMQAMGRVWRPGQTKAVFIYRLIVEGTIEEAILQRQEEKMMLYTIAKRVSSSYEMDADEELPIAEKDASSCAVNYGDRKRKILEGGENQEDIDNTVEETSVYYTELKNISSEALRKLVYPSILDSSRRGVSVEKVVQDMSEEDSVLSCAYALLKKSRWELFFKYVSMSKSSQLIK